MSQPRPPTLWMMWLATILACGSAGCTSARSSPSAASPAIVLCTDYGTSDWYVGELKGAILAIHPGARIFDLTHEIPAFDIREGAYILARGAESWPSGTIFVGVVDPGVGAQRRAIALRSRAGRIYVGPDNGLFTLVLEAEGIEEGHILRDRRWWREVGRDAAGSRPVRGEDSDEPLETSATFHGRDIFGPVAAHLAKGVPMKDLGPWLSEPERFEVVRPIYDYAALRGQVLHVDRYGNLSTNLTRALVDRVHWSPGDSVEVWLGEKRQAFRYGRTCGDVPEGDYVMLVGSACTIELARNMASCTVATGAKAGTEMRISLRKEPGH